MSSSSIPAWATVDEESNNLYYRAIGAGAPANGLLFKSSAAVYLGANSCETCSIVRVWQIVVLFLCALLYYPIDFVVI